MRRFVLIRAFAMASLRPRWRVKRMGASRWHTGQETLDLEEPWGRCEFMDTPHSEQLTVPLADGIREKGIREFTWRLHLPRREQVKAGFGQAPEIACTTCDAYSHSALSYF